MKQLYIFFFMALSCFLGNAQLTQVLDINDGSGNSSPTNLTVYNGQLYFSADDQNGSNSPGGIDVGREVWVTDGTGAGTSLFFDVRTGSSNSSPFAFFELGGTLYFSANDGGGSRIWETDGTSGGTSNTNNGFSNFNPRVIGGKAYMVATTLGNAFYEFDGTTFQEVPDNGTGVAVPLGGEFIEFDANTILLYMDYSIDEPTIGRELYKYDIPTQRYTLIRDVDMGTGDSSISNFTKIGSTVYFEADNALWQTDGDESGTGTILVGVADTAGISNVSNFFAWNGNLYFEGDDGNGDQLWVYNPNLDTVTNLSNISGTNVNHDPSDYAALNGFIYYRAKDANDSDSHLFRTDGTTVEQLDNTIKDIDEVTVFNGILYFEGDDNTTGNELYSLDPSTLSIQSVNLNNTVNIYPNPSKDVINVTMTRSIDFNYSIYDVNGRNVLQGTLLNNRINHNLDSGMYFLNLQSQDGGTITKKIIVE
ncbi:MAG: T9SS type A sorting domain-containing protein [Bacteroidota bacterium]